MIFRFSDCQHPQRWGMLKWSRLVDLIPSVSKPLALSPGFRAVATCQTVGSLHQQALGSTLTLSPLAFKTEPDSPEAWTQPLPTPSSGHLLASCRFHHNLALTVPPSFRSQKQELGLGREGSSVCVWGETFILKQSQSKFEGGILFNSFN